MDQSSSPVGNGPAAGVPTCFRHPGRETYLSCVRCGRSACPDCLREAPVGHQCVECVKEGHHGVRQAVGAFGGQVPSGTLITYILVGINIALYVVGQGGNQNLEMVGHTISCVRQVGNECYGPTFVGVADGQYWRLLTSAFIPGSGGLGILDIAFNMWALWIVGPGLERMLGRSRYLTVYLMSALGGAVLYYLIASPDQYAAGASGAIFGLFGAWFVAAKRLQLDPRPIVILIGLNLVISFVGHNFIAWQDHIGGLIVGGLLTAAFAYAPRSSRTAVQVGATIVIGLILVATVLARNHALLA